MDPAMLDGQTIRAVSEVFDKLKEHTHAGVYLERINSCRDDRFRAIGITWFWRGVVLASESNAYVLYLRSPPLVNYRVG